MVSLFLNFWTCVGSINSGSGACFWKNSWCWIKNRHCSYPRKNRFLLRRPFYHLKESHSSRRVCGHYNFTYLYMLRFNTRHRLIEKGGDWDRRNRLKVYQGLHSLSIRQFKRACDLFVDALSTFTATELLSYNDFVSLTMITSTLTMSRPDLKKKVSIRHFELDLLVVRLILHFYIRSLAHRKLSRFFTSFRSWMNWQSPSMIVIITNYLLRWVGTCYIFYLFSDS